MTASIASIASLTEMIISSLDHEKVLKDKLQEKQLEYILGLLLENNIITLSGLFTLNNKEMIQKMIEQQIDHNNNINVTVKANDKNEFSNIVMDVIQSKMQNQRNGGDKFCYDKCINKMSAENYQTASDQIPSFAFGSYEQTPPHQPQPPMCPIFDAPPQLNQSHYQPTTTLSNKQPPEPALNFDLETPFDDLISINTFDSMPISQAQLSATNTPNMANKLPHQIINTPTTNIEDIVNTMSQPQSQTSAPNDNNLANTFAEKMNKAIASKINASNTPPSHHSKSKPLPTKKITTLPQQNTIHPQHKPQSQQPPPPPIYDEYEYYENEEETGVPLGGMDAPQITLSNVENRSSYNHTQNHNGHTTHGAQNAYVAPTPREWEFQWEASPRGAPQSRTPATSPPRIRDPMLIKNALEGVAYYADKLDSLHSEYRRVYTDQQQLQQNLQSLQKKSNNMDITEYQHRYKTIEQSYYQMSYTLQSLIIGIYENFTKMKRSLDTKYEFQLDHSRRSQFDRFQRYYDQFAATQQHLLQFGGQQWKLKEQEKQRQQSQQYNYKVPPTPHHYRQIVSNAYSQQQENEYKQSYNNSNNMYQRHQQHIKSMTPRENNNNRMQTNYPWMNKQQQQSYPPQHNNYIVNYPKTTSAIPDRKFQWNKDAYYKQGQQQNQVAMNGNMNGNLNRNMSQTPRASSSKKTTGDIPNMGYVYIGSRMSQLISHISLSDGEVNANELRILNCISDILKKDEKQFNGFDIITYGSAKHKLFIKDYSDFDFCVRCKKLGNTHNDSIKYINDALSKNNDFEKVKIIETIDDSIHGHYLNNISHIKFVDKKSHCHVDLVLNNLPEIGSSRFIAAYESIDPRFALLCRVVKYWSGQRKINDPINGTLSTYSLVLMVINFLQLRRVLPTLSIMTFDREAGLSPWSTQDDYQINVQKYRDFASKNEEPHSKLLVNFFYFYSHKFNFNKDVVSVRTGTYLTKSEKKWNKDNDKHALCVENPFNSKTNLTENVDKKSLKRINEEFHRAYAILCESYKIYEVCKLADKIQN